MRSWSAHGGAACTTSVRSHPYPCALQKLAHFDDLSWTNDVTDNVVFSIGARLYRLWVAEDDDELLYALGRDDPDEQDAILRLDEHARRERLASLRERGEASHRFLLESTDLPPGATKDQIADLLAGMYGSEVELETNDERELMRHVGDQLIAARMAQHPKAMRPNPPAIRFLVKGSAEQALRAAAARGIPIVVVGGTGKETTLEAPEEYRERIGYWYGEEGSPPYPPGTLLHYTSVEAPPGYRYPHTDGAARALRLNPEPAVLDARLLGKGDLKGRQQLYPTWLPDETGIRIEVLGEGGCPAGTLLLEPPYRWPGPWTLRAFSGRKLRTLGPRSKELRRIIEAANQNAEAA